MSTAIFTSVQECAQFLMFLIKDELYVPGSTELQDAVNAVGAKLNQQKSGEESLTL